MSVTSNMTLLMLSILRVARKYQAWTVMLSQNNVNTLTQVPIKIISSSQSGFCPGDSSVHQLLSITYDIHKSFDANPLLEVWGIFLDMSKVFSRVWHEGFLFKLKRLRLSGQYYGLINSFLRNRHQRVVFNGRSSKWSPIKAGINFSPIDFLRIHK